MADELYERMVQYYSDDPNVKVIVDRRESERRVRGAEPPPGNKRERRDRRRPRVPGEFPEIEVAS
jgi:hypothetical protein